jgi:hypothetical protein
MMGGRTARSFGGLRMTVKVGGCHSRIIAFGVSFRDSTPVGMSSYVCRRLIKWRNSQILRRPQDDRHPQNTVILRPPKDLAVL